MHFILMSQSVLVPQLWTGACVVVALVLTKLLVLKKLFYAVGAKLIYLSPPAPDFSRLMKTVGQRSRSFCDRLRKSRVRHRKQPGHIKN